MKTVFSWHSDRIQHALTLVRWGHWGTPVILFPTAGGDAEEAERMGAVAAR
jgi:esterase/lipase superfamily enzyme